MSVLEIDKESLCRFCLGEVKKLINPGSRDNIIVDVNTIFNLEIFEEDDWPKQICESCKNTSKICIAFFQKIKDAEEKLLEIFGEKLKDLSEVYHNEEIIVEVKDDEEVQEEEEIHLLKEDEVIQEVDEIELLEEDESYSKSSWAFTSGGDCEYEEPIEIDNKISPSSSKKKLGRWRKDGSKKMKILRENNDVVKKYLGFKCDLCSEEAKNYYALKFHFRETHEITGYMVCCNTKFTSLGRLAGHVKIHMDPEAFKCPRCSRILSNEVTFRVHARECSKNPNLTYTNICELCSEAFPTPRMLRQHQKKHLSEDEKPHQCPDCPKRYTTPAEMNHHWAQVHNTERNYSCDICGKTFRTQSQANGHKKNTHIKGRGPKVRCERCGGFYPELNMYSHLQRCNVDPVQCNLCGKEYCNVPALKNHIKYDHEGAERKKFACNICPKVFSTKRKLTDHTAKHQDIALHKCTWCDKKFYTLSTKTAHQRTQHPAENAAAKIRKH
ncbi:zinc finger protein 320-like [Lutzomyia longipalpis]|uniref:zinc finger protein 320-like n=1 Tax=Lutzomyia longipalpis TaxID=7200 RepID=UPI002483ACD8|nr:zinc finger protein 320-like [Lutzomyia longipalpis]